MSLPRTSVLVLPLSCNLPLIFTFILLHNTPYTLFLFFHPLCTRRVTSASSSPSSANVDPRYVNVFTLRFFSEEDSDEGPSRKAGRNANSPKPSEAATFPSRQLPVPPRVTGPFASPRQRVVDVETSPRLQSLQVAGPFASPSQRVDNMTTPSTMPSTPPTMSSAPATTGKCLLNLLIAVTVATALYGHFRWAIS